LSVDSEREGIVFFREEIVDRDEVLDEELWRYWLFKAAVIWTFLMDPDETNEYEILVY
jgi:hypothetical protein